MRALVVIQFLFSSVALLGGTLLIWEQTAVSRDYHVAVAWCAEVVRRAVGMEGVREILLSDDEFLARVVVGDRLEALYIEPLDITSSLCVLLSLYLAWPIRPPRKRFATYVVGSVALLFWVHVATLLLVIDGAIGWHGAGLSGADQSWLAPWAYPLVLLLWAPYILRQLRERTEASSSG